MDADTEDWARGDVEPGGGDLGAEDAVVAEIRAAREALFAEAGYDFEELSRRLQERQNAAGRHGVVLPPRAADASSEAA